MKLLIIVLGIPALFFIVFIVLWTMKIYKLLQRFEKEAIAEVSQAKIDFDETVKGVFNPIASVKKEEKVHAKMKEAEKC